MIKQVSSIGKSLGLSVKHNVAAGETIWATKRRIKVVLSREVAGRSKQTLGIDCFCQEGAGTANQKAFAKLLDVKEYPILFSWKYLYFQKCTLKDFRS
jgi:hypothetical protein